VDLGVSGVAIMTAVLASTYRDGLRDILDPTA